MKDLKTIYGNWRCVALATIALVAFLLAVCEAETLLVLVLAKGAAIALVAVLVVLCRQWARAGKINELLDVDE